MSVITGGKAWQPIHGIVSIPIYFLITPPYRAITTATGIRWTLDPAVAQSVRDRHHGESQRVLRLQGHVASLSGV